MRSIWARPWENVSYVICEQQRRRSACASAQSDQRLYCSLPRQNDTCSSFIYIRNFKILASLCSWAGQFLSCLVGDSRRHIFSWRGSLIYRLFKWYTLSQRYNPTMSALFWQYLRVSEFNDSIIYPKHEHTRICHLNRSFWQFQNLSEETRNRAAWKFIELYSLTFLSNKSKQLLVPGWIFSCFQKLSWYRVCFKFSWNWRRNFSSDMLYFIGLKYRVENTEKLAFLIHRQAYLSSANCECCGDRTHCVSKLLFE